MEQRPLLPAEQGEDTAEKGILIELTTVNVFFSL